MKFMNNEYLEELTNKIRYKKEHVRDDTYRLFIKKNELEFLEKALEVLGYIGGLIIPTNNGNQYLKDFCDREFTTIKQVLLKAQEDKKILKILFKKRIDIDSFYIAFRKDVFDYNYYKKHYGLYGLECLTQEEFNSIKEMLK